MGAGDHHAALADAYRRRQNRSGVCRRPGNESLWEALPKQHRGAYAENSAALAPELLAALKPGDTVLVKGSFGSKMAVIVDALKARG